MSKQPYIGLRPFERNETDIFFGREQHSDELINRLGSSHFLAVIGTSGCGKSSLVKTGLIAGLEAGYLAKAGTHWRIVEMRPGQQPFQALADKLFSELNDVLSPDYTAETLQQALRHGSLSLHELLAEHPLPNAAQLLIVCDQFEEIFRYFQQGESAEARNFVSLLLASSKPYPLSPISVSHSLYVVITMRSDFLGDCAQFAGLAEAINQGLYLTPRLDAQQLRAAIEEPAFVFGGEVEPALVTRLLEDAGNNQDQLPLLQHVLMRLWDLATDKAAALTLADYEAVGGLTNALSRHADEVYDELTYEQKRIAEVLFRNLTESDNSKRDTRRPIQLAEIIELTGATFAEVVAVIDEFRQAGCCFLMPPINVALNDDCMIDISHESLIRQWQRLKGWTADEAESAKTYQRLEDRAIEWENHKTSLLQSPELEIHQQWWQEKQPTALWAKRYGKDFELARNFLNTSQTATQQRLDSENKHRRFLMIGLIVFSMIVSGLAFWAWQESQRAEQQTTLALQAEQQAKEQTKLALDSIKNLTYDLIEDLNKLKDTLPVIEKIIDSNIELLEKIDTPQAIREKAVNFSQLADVYLRLDDKITALEWAGASLIIFKQIAEQNSEDLTAQQDLSISFSKINNIYLQLTEKQKSLVSQEIRHTLAMLEFKNVKPSQSLQLRFERQDDDYLKLVRAESYYQQNPKSIEYQTIGETLMTLLGYIVFFVVFFLVPGLLIYHLDADMDIETERLKRFETLLSMLTIGILIVISINFYRNYREKAENIKSLAAVSALKLEASIHYSEYGTWLDNFDTDSSYYGKFSLEKDGVIIIHRKDKNEQLTITPVVRKDQYGVVNDSMLWLCGYAKAPTAYSTTAITPPTTIPALQLPHDCVY